MNQTKVMISGEQQKVTQKVVRWPCGVRGRGIGNKFNAVYQLSELDTQECKSDEVICL